MRTIEVNGTDLTYRQTGTGDAIVFVHGGINDLRVWEHQMESFGSRYRAVALSCRHFHPNPPPQDDQQLPLSLLAEDLAAFLRELDLAPAHLIGSSSGAFVCMLLARDRPDLVRTLVLAEPPVLPILGVDVPPRPRQMVTLLLRSPAAAAAVLRLGAGGIGPALRAYARGKPEAAALRFTKAVLGRRDAASLSEPMRQQIRDNARTFGAQLQAGLPSFDAADARGLARPVLLVTGERSAPVHHHVTDALDGLLPASARVDLDDASHLMFHDRPEAFNRAALEFLRNGGAVDDGTPGSSDA